jgi:hypothetical protein
MFNFPGSPATAAGAAWTTAAVCAASATAAHFCPTFYLRQYNYVSTEHGCSKALRNSNNVVSHTLIRCLLIILVILIVPRNWENFCLDILMFSVLTVPWHCASIIALVLSYSVHVSLIFSQWYSCLSDSFDERKSSC